MAFSLSKETAATVARTACLALALTNQVLNAVGIQAIPIQDADLNTLVTTGFTVAASVVNWWCNQNFTPAAKAGQKVTDAIKSGSITTDDVKTITG